MYWQKNSKALAASAGGGVPARAIPGKREACLRSCPDEPSYVPLSKLSRSADGTADADSRDRSGASAVRISEDSRVVEPGGLESRQISSGTDLSGRRINAAATAETASASGRASSRTLSSDGPESGVVDGLCCRPVGGRKKISLADGVGYLHARMPGDRVGAEAEGRRRSASAEPDQDHSRSTEDGALRQWKRILQSGDGPVGLSAGGANGIFATGEADRQRLRGIIQRDVSRGVSECPLVLFVDRGAADRGDLAWRIQRESPSPGSRGEDAQRIRQGNRG